jgi:hypothetical protein
MAWTTPGTATAGEVLTASFWNTQVRDNMIELDGPFTSQSTWTPTLDQNGARTKTVNRAAYTKIGNFLFGLVTMSITQTGSAGNAISSDLPSGTDNRPSASGSGLDNIGVFTYFTASGTRYSGSVVWDSNNVKLIFMSTGATGFGALGSSPSFATANGDVITYNFFYWTA